VNTAGGAGNDDVLVDDEDNNDKNASDTAALIGTYFGNPVHNSFT
jgi:hypothetical protein